MRVDEVIIQEISQAQQDAMKQMRDIHTQRRIKGIGTDTSTYGSQIGQSVGTDVEVGDLTNVGKKGSKDTEVDKDVNTPPKKSEPSKDKPSGPSSTDLRRQAQRDALRGRVRPSGAGASSSDEPTRIGSDGRKLKHDRYYGQSAELDDYDNILPDFGIKKGAETAKRYAANFVRDPSKTMANLRYKFKDLLQK